MFEFLTMFWGYLVSLIVPRFFEFMTVPFRDQETLSIVIPLLASLTMMEIYFGRHKTEELGWNTAFGNTVSLFFVMAGLSRYLLASYSIPELLAGGRATYKFLLVGLLVVQALVLVSFNYKHSIPKRFAFLISSSLPVNVTAFLAIILVMGKIPFDAITLGAALFTFVVFWIAFTLLQTCISPTIGAKIVLSRRRHERAEHRKELIRRIKGQLRGFYDRMAGHFNPPLQ